MYFGVIFSFLLLSQATYDPKGKYLPIDESVQPMGKRYWYLDFDDRRGPDVDPEDIKNLELMQVGLQKLVDEMLAAGKTLPEPQLKQYDSWEAFGSIGAVHYVTLTVNLQ